MGPNGGASGTPGAVASRCSPSAPNRIRRCSKPATAKRLANHLPGIWIREQIGARGARPGTTHFSPWLSTGSLSSRSRCARANALSKEILVALKTIESEGLLETARRSKQRGGEIFRHAIGIGHASRDITVGRIGAVLGRPSTRIGASRFTSVAARVTHHRPRLPAESTAAVDEFGLVVFR